MQAQFTGYVNYLSPGDVQHRRAKTPGIAIAAQGRFVSHLGWSVETPEPDPCKGWRFNLRRKRITLPGEKPRKNDVLASR